MKNWFVKNREGLAIGAVISLAVGIFIAAIIFLPSAEDKRAEITEPQYQFFCNDGSSRGNAANAFLKGWYVLGDGFKVFYMDGGIEWFAGGNQCSILELK